jgi:hypothetical protein
MCSRQEEPVMHSTEQSPESIQSSLIFRELTFLLSLFGPDALEGFVGPGVQLSDPGQTLSYVMRCIEASKSDPSDPP